MEKVIKYLSENLIILKWQSNPPTNIFCPCKVIVWIKLKGTVEEFCCERVAAAIRQRLKGSDESKPQLLLR